MLTTPTPFSQAFQSGAAGLSRSPGHTRAFLNYGAWENGEVTFSAEGLALRLHAKYTLLTQSPRAPALAVGVTELFGRATSLYAVVGGNLQIRASGSRLRLAGGAATHGALPSLFASAEVRVSPVASLQTEWSRRINAGVLLHPTAQFRVLIGVVRRHPGLGVSYDVGL